MNDSDAKEKLALREEIIIQTAKFLKGGGQITKFTAGWDQSPPREKKLFRHQPLPWSRHKNPVG